MFQFFKKKTPPPAPSTDTDSPPGGAQPDGASAPDAAPAAAGRSGWLDRLRQTFSGRGQDAAVPPEGATPIPADGLSYHAQQADTPSTPAQAALPDQQPEHPPADQAEGQPESQSAAVQPDAVPGVAPGVAPDGQPAAQPHARPDAQSEPRPAPSPATATASVAPLAPPIAAPAASAPPTSPAPAPVIPAPDVPDASGLSGPSGQTDTPIQPQKPVSQPHQGDTPAAIPASPVPQADAQTGRDPQAAVASTATTATDATTATAPGAAEAASGADTAPARQGWLQRLTSGLRRTGSSISSVFVGTRIDDALYEELEAALLMADVGVQATQHLLDDLKARVKAARATDPAQVRALLADAVADLLAPLQKPLVIGEHTPTIIMVAGVNGAGKTTSIGKLTRHLAEHEQRVLLAAADTFRAAAREQLAIWADRNTVDIISSTGGDPAALAFDAISAGRARGCDVVLVDTAGRLPTQLHLMDELKKIHRTVAKADPSGPHEVLLVIDGNTGQNALAQVKAFHAALPLTGLIVTKLDGTAKGGVLCAIAREQPVPVYFVGVGEQLQDLQTFDAREFAQAMLGL